MDPIPFPAPYGGMNDYTPVIALQSPQCEYLLNFNIDEAGISLRNGDSIYNRFSTAIANPLALYKIINYQGTDLLIFTVNLVSLKAVIFEGKSGSLVHTSVNNFGATFIYTVMFNKYLFFFSPTGSSGAPGLYYNGVAFGQITLTGSGFVPRSGNVYKNRMYIVQDDDAAYWYTELYAISGALNKVDLNTITEERTQLASIASFTIADNVSSITLQSFIFFNGEVLFYTGAYPDSADWSLVGKARIGQAVDYATFISYQGDTLILCDIGVISLRDLFLKGGEQAGTFSFSYQVSKVYQKLIKKLREDSNVYTGPLDNNFSLLWDQLNNRILIRSSYFYNEDTDSLDAKEFYFVYDTLLKSWSLHLSENAWASSLTVWENHILGINQDSAAQVINVMEKEGADIFTDRNNLDTLDVGYDFDMVSAPVANGRAYVQQGQGLDVILQTDMYDVTEYKFIKNFGEGETSPQKTTGISTSIQKPFINIGIEGSYIQYEISGTTNNSASIGLSIYGVNFWQQLGNETR